MQMLAVLGGATVDLVGNGKIREEIGHASRILQAI
jgi:hypothetical protein